MEFYIKILKFIILFIVVRTRFSTSFPLEDKNTADIHPALVTYPGRTIRSGDSYCSADLSIKRIEDGEKAAFGNGLMTIIYELKGSKETARDVTVELKMSIPTEYGEISEECVIENSTMIRCSYGTLEEDKFKYIIINLKRNNSIPTDEKDLIVEAEAKTSCDDYAPKDNFVTFPIKFTEEKAEENAKKNAKGFDWTPLKIVSIIFIIFIIGIIILKRKWICNKYNQYMPKDNNSAINDNSRRNIL